MTKDEYTNFGDMCRMKLGRQAQYVSRYIDGVIPGYPNLGYGLRFTGFPGDYHTVTIHRDDVEEFIRRINEHLNHGDVGYTEIELQKSLNDAHLKINELQSESIKTMKKLDYIEGRDNEIAAWISKLFDLHNKDVNERNENLVGLEAEDRRLENEIKNIQNRLKNLRKN